MFFTKRLPCATLEEWNAAISEIRAGRYGVIETKAGRLVSIHLRCWPKLIDLPDLWPVGDRHHRRGPTDCCWLYYNQPRRFPNFLALKYLVTSQATNYSTLRVALKTLDAVAELKQTDALLCDAANHRISDRSLARQGWQAHKPQRWHRNFIKRFYGVYPASVPRVSPQESPCLHAVNVE